MRTGLLVFGLFCKVKRFQPCKAFVLPVCRVIGAVQRKTKAVSTLLVELEGTGSTDFLHRISQQLAVLVAYGTVLFAVCHEYGRHILAYRFFQLAIKHMMKLLTDGQNGGMFPQGTRHPKKDPRETEVKSGAGMITIRTQATVVPVFIDQKNFKHRAFRRSTVYIGKPITFEEFNYDSEAPGEKARISKQIFDAVCKLGEEHGALK